MQNKTSLSVDDLAARWQVHPNTIRRQIAAGTIPKPMKIGNQFRWLHEVIESFERNQTEVA